MTQSCKEKILDKWKPILESMGATGSRLDWMSQYTNMYSSFDMPIQPGDLDTPTQPSFDNTLLPLSIKIASQTIATDLVAVQPMGVSGNKLDEIKKEVKTENRERKIDSLIEGKEFEEMRVEDHPDYSGPKIDLMYLDFQYNATQSKRKKK